MVIIYNFDIYFNYSYIKIVTTSLNVNLIMKSPSLAKRGQGRFDKLKLTNDI